MSEANVPSNHLSRTNNGRLPTNQPSEPGSESGSEPQPVPPNHPLTKDSIEQAGLCDRLAQSEDDRSKSLTDGLQKDEANVAAAATNRLQHDDLARNPKYRHEDHAEHPNLSEELATAAETWLQSSGSTDLSDLISLIQELNQCNSILLDRVAQLEQALERSQNALKAEVKRSQHHSTNYSTDFAAEYNAAEWGNEAALDFTLTQGQTIDLYQQLEAVHQTSQRQQILIETLTGQLESSQERVAQLEREAALVQQRYNDQAQRLIQTENNCRDLQARLHRQQRYTLQFKAALEKSLDVATPAFESVAETMATAGDRSFVPKVQHIQPWVSPKDISPARFPWMNLSATCLDSETPDADTETGQAFDPSNLPIVRSRRSRLAAVTLPGFQSIDKASIAPSGQKLSGKDTEVHPAGHQNVAKLSQEPARESMVPDEQLLQKLDSVVQPLADLIADAMLSDNQEAEQRETPQVSHWDVTPEPCPPRSSVTQAHDATADCSEEGRSSRSADDLLNSVMADAEDALWQDLARLIDVSTEEVVKASLSGDLSAFESIDFQALQETAADRPSESDLSPWFEPDSQNQPIKASDKKSSITDWVEAEPTQAAVESNLVESNLPEVSTPPATSAFDNPGWPSPVVYPARSAKKRRSLAAVDLPSFLQQAPGPLPT
jgi:hypothetical protein